MECYQPAEYGYPVTDYADGVQGFQTGAIFLAGQQVLGASGGIYRKWGYSRFGPPVAAREDFNGVSRQRFTGGVIGTLQYFEGGVICHRKAVTVGLSRWAFPFRHVILWWKVLVNG